jgi:putative membrane protein
MLGALVAAQALALGALAQTPEAQQQQSARERTQSTTGSASSTRDAAHETDQHSSTDASATPVTPQSFASQAAVIGKAEIELAQVALNSTKNEDIRKYAERMVRDHTAADQKLRKIAQKENLQLPQTLDAKHQKEKQRLSSLRDEAFDREYKKHMEQGHQEAVALFQSASQDEQMPEDLKDFAASSLPTLKRHHEMAQKLESNKEGV